MTVPRSEMRTAVYDRYGPPEVLYTARMPVPAPQAGEVLVKVAATSVNGGELFARSGKVGLVIGNTFPKRVGIDFVGEVVGSGPGVTTPPGHRVWGTVSERFFGAAAEYVAVPASRVARAPENLSPVDAASLLIGGTTAITALREHGRIQPDERLLIRGAAGGVGSVAVQIGKLFGAHVTALAGTGAAEHLHGLGADEVLDYRTIRPVDLGSYDVIIDIVGREQSQFRRLLAPGGRMVAIGLDSDRLLRSLGSIAASAVHGSRRVRFFRGDPDRRLLAELARYAEQGTVRPVVDQVFDLDQLADAHRRLESGGVRGKLIIAIG